MEVLLSRDKCLATFLAALQVTVTVAINSGEQQNGMYLLAYPPLINGYEIL